MDFQYTPSPFMLPTSYYDAKRADHAVAFIQNLKHTKGKWDGKPFLLAGRDHPYPLWDGKGKRIQAVQYLLLRDTEEERKVRTGSGHRTVSSLWGWRGKCGGVWLRQ